MTFRNKGFGEMSSSRLDSHRNSVQNGMVERVTAFMATIFVQNFKQLPGQLPQSWSLYSQSTPIGWLQSANRLEFPIGSIGWWRRSADRLWQTRLPASGRPIGCGRLKKVVVTKTFAPKFSAECTDRHIHSSHGDRFRDHFCVYRT